jgi:hypothetical protein
MKTVKKAVSFCQLTVLVSKKSVANIANGAKANNSVALLLFAETA